MAQALSLQSLDSVHIDRELDRLIGEAAPSGARACLLNLVAYTEPGSSNYARLLAGLTGRRPMRVIHVEEDPAAEQTYAAVAAVCYPPGADTPGSPENICLEEVRLFSGRDRRGYEPASWVPLLRREIPVALLWLLGPEPVPELVAKAEVVDKVIVDSAAGDDGEAAAAAPGGSRLEAVSRLAEQLAPVPVADLAWRRIHPWRLALAEAFDPTPCRALLPLLTEVQLRGLPPVEAQLLALWLGSRLGWRGRLAADGLRLVTGGGREVAVSVQPATPRPADATVRCATAQAAVAISAFDDHLAVSYQGLAVPGQIRAHRVAAAADVLFDELECSRRDVFYEQALAAGIGDGAT